MIFIILFIFKHKYQRNMFGVSILMFFSPWNSCFTTSLRKFIWLGIFQNGATWLLTGISKWKHALMIWQQGIPVFYFKQHVHLNSTTIYFDFKSQASVFCLWMIFTTWSFSLSWLFWTNDVTFMSIALSILVSVKL